MTNDNGNGNDNNTLVKAAGVSFSANEVDALFSKEANVLHELLGAQVNPLLTGLAGAAAGGGIGAGASILSEDDPANGALYGALAGLGLGTLLPSIGGAAAAGINRTRTDEEQDDAHKEVGRNYMLPGRGVYNYLKRIGNQVKHEDKSSVKALVAGHAENALLAPTPGLGQILALAAGPTELAGVIRGNSGKTTAKGKRTQAIPLANVYERGAIAGRGNRRMNDREKKKQSV